MPSEATEPDLRKTLDEYDEGLAVAQTAIDNLISSLEEYREDIIEWRRRVDQGEPADLVVKSIGGAQRRFALNEALEGFTHCRDALRTAIIAAGVLQGRSIAEMGRHLGLSRQYAAHLLADARARQEP